MVFCYIILSPPSRCGILPRKNEILLCANLCHFWPFSRPQKSRLAFSLSSANPLVKCEVAITSPPVRLFLVLSLRIFKACSIEFHTLVPSCSSFTWHWQPVFKLPRDSLFQADTNSGRFQHLQLWFKNKKEGWCLEKLNNCFHLFFLEIGKARDGLSFRQLWRTCTSLFYLFCQFYLFYRFSSWGSFYQFNTWLALTLPSLGAVDFFGDFWSAADPKLFCTLKKSLFTSCQCSHQAKKKHCQRHNGPRVLTRGENL